MVSLSQWQSFQPNFNQFSGYLTLNATTDKSMFYWFVESQNNPANDPVRLIYCMGM